ncbi:MAG: type I DNA topoisomerase [Planctomyces sp.]|nr:type I DNA topoisomerase [Planctomyces sp.]
MAAKRKKGLVIVESPAKAKKIGGFLGSDYEVRASMGHVRDLPKDASEIPEELKKQSWARLGVNIDEEFAPLYVVAAEKKKVVKDLQTLLKNVDELILATDEDREGESIGWHLAELLKPNVPVKRMTFDEITKPAILKAIQNTRELDQNLVQAQETRRVLDRLYGYTLSPLLWKKIRRGLSAGRVQSVAVRVLVRRELERLAFVKGSYWDLKATLETPKNVSFPAQLATVGGRRVAQGKDFDESTGRIQDGVDVLLLEEAAARELRERLQRAVWTVTDVEQRPQKRSPAPPFTTSTLQQEANRKLGLSARETMQVAQRLYEDGAITYMRTDSVSLSREAVTAARGRIADRYGADYLFPGEQRQYSNRTKNAQEAHEAIRPAGTEMQTGEELGLSGRELRLYDLIWKRTMASQMADARLIFTTATIAAENAEFRATGRQIEFPGFFRAYVEGSDDPEAALEDQDSTLPPLETGQTLNCRDVEALGHETKPPARYTEATLVRKLEEEGVGRPSTYASIIGTIQDRGYVRKANNQLIPTFTALAVTRLLEQYFPQLVDLQFTAQMEQSLDDISNGQADRLPYLKKFYSGDEGLEGQVKAKEEQIDPRQACTIQLDRLQSAVRVGKFGPYLERQLNGDLTTASLPDDISPADLSNELAEELFLRKQQGPKSLGMETETGKPILVMNGPFGPYLQLGEIEPEGPKPKRVSIPKTMDPDAVEFETAVALLSLPRQLGKHPEDNKVVNAGIGRFGPYVQHAGKYKSLGKDDDVLTITLERAVELLKEVKGRAAVTPLKELGEHPSEGGPVQVFEGRYGPYVKHQKTNATIPKDRDPTEITLDEAVALLAARAASGKKKPARGGRKSTPSTAARKTPKRGKKKDD